MKIQYTANTLELIHNAIEPYALYRHHSHPDRNKNRNNKTVNWSDGLPIYIKSTQQRSRL